MHVVQIINNLPVGGAERFLLQLSAALASHNVRTTVVSLADPNPLAVELQRRGIAFECMQRKRLNDPRLIIDLVRMLKRLQPDIVHTHLFYADTFGRVAARVARVPAIVSTEHSTEAGSISWRRRVGMRWTAPLAHRVVAVSTAVQRAMAQRLGVDTARIRVIPNGIELDSWSDVEPHARGDLGVPDDVLLVGCVGRLVASKGYAQLLEAVARIPDEPTPLRLLMVGDGPARAGLEEACRNPALASRVQWLGLREDVPRILKTLDVFALPSFWEGQSLALLEAMAAGCACLVSDIPEIRESVGEAALRVQPGDARSIEAGLRELLQRPARRLQLADAARRAVREFSIENAARRYVALYNEIRKP